MADAFVCSIPNPIKRKAGYGEAKQWLESHVHFAEEDCLIWPFAKTNTGRGKLGLDGKTAIASRVMCTLAHGKPPTRKHEAAHSCNNGHEGCVHPKHLRWATPVENAADREITENHNRGENNPSSLLTEDDVVSIRYLCSHGVQQLTVARMFGIAKETVFGIYRNGRWPHVVREHTIIKRV